ncbi:hypothetical protein [Streptomyces sp. KLOTTS4A1]|uniref:hypothetical protein n=1 Tax=Streptomyces sp. KLOTTS4A1 TaxID=3390996 RepID=UPI0039F6148F
MRVRVKNAGLVAAAVGAAALAVAVPAEAVPAEVVPAEVVPAEVVAPEADVAYHGHTALWQGRLGVWLTPQNHGPADVSDATVRLRTSAPLADGQELPDRCLRGGQRVVLCSTGGIGAGGWSEELALDLRLKGSPSEVTVRIDTVWNGGAQDRNTANNRHKVLTLETGDLYAF